MYIGLTGSPRVAGLQAGDQGSVVGRAVDESVLSRRRGGLVVVLEERFRLAGEITWPGLSEIEALGRQSDLGYVCDLDLRTHRAGDPSWASELTVRARRLSDIELTASNRRIGVVSGRPVPEIQYAWESLQTYTLAELGLASGFFSITDLNGQRTLRAHDGATITRDDGQPVTLRDGSTVTIHTLTLGPATTAARYVRRAAVGGGGSQLLLTSRD